MTRDLALRLPSTDVLVIISRSIVPIFSAQQLCPAKTILRLSPGWLTLYAQAPAWSLAAYRQFQRRRARGRLANLMRCMQLVGFRIQELQRVLPLLMQLQYVQSVQHQGGDTLKDLRGLMDKLARNPGEIDANCVRSTLTRAESALEQTIEKTLQAGKLTREQVKVVYSALGALRGLLMSLSEARDEVVLLDWQRLREARFQSCAPFFIFFSGFGESVESYSSPAMDAAAYERNRFPACVHLLDHLTAWC